MTADQALALGRRCVACKAWRWMTGMSTMDLETVVCVGDGAVYVVAPNRPMQGRWTGVATLNVQDPATLGCLLALVRELYADDALIVAAIDYGPGGVMWQAQLTLGGRRLTERHYGTEAEALVAALEAAP